MWGAIGIYRDSIATLQGQESSLGSLGLALGLNKDTPPIMQRQTGKNMVGLYSRGGQLSTILWSQAPYMITAHCPQSDLKMTSTFGHWLLQYAERNAALGLVV